MSSRFSVAANCESLTLSLSMAWRCGAHPRGPKIASASMVALGPVPHSSTLITFFCLPVAWPAGSVVFAGRLAGLCARVCTLQSFLAVCQVLSSKSARDLAHLRYSARLLAASQRQYDHDCLHFCAAAHAAPPPYHIWPKRVRRASLLLPESLPSAPPLNRYLCCHVRSQASVAWECALAPYPASDNVTARGRRRRSGTAVHLNPLRCSLSMSSPPLLLRFPAPLVYAFRCVLSGQLPFSHSVPLDSLPLHGLCPRSNCQVCITRPPPATTRGYTLVECRWRSGSPAFPVQLHGIPAWLPGSYRFVA
jgi:hypothetical protein